MDVIISFMRENWGWMLSFGTFCVGMIIYVTNKTNAIRKGVQALLRAQMINDYNLWTERGYAPVYARDNFENCWKNYEALGVNGVMKSIHDKFMALPTRR